MLNFSLDYHHVPTATLAHVASNLDLFTHALRSCDEVHGFVALATCARIEFYIDAPHTEQFARMFQAVLVQVSATTQIQNNVQFQQRRDQAAVEHLFRVTAGLESQVVGETEILGQVRTALATARNGGSLSRTLELAFSRAIHVSRKVRATFAPGQRTLIHSALSQLNIGEAKFALLIGTGEYARVCAQALREVGVSVLVNYSPSGRKDDALDVDGWTGAEQLETFLAKSDVVVACSGRGEYVLTADNIIRALERRTENKGKLLQIIDLASSADVSYAVDELAGVQVIRLAEIKSDEINVSVATQLIQDGVRDAMPRILDTELDDFIVKLRSHITAIIRPSVQHHDAVTTHKVIQALLHTPTIRAKQAAAAGRLDEVRNAFEMLFSFKSPLDCIEANLQLDELDLLAFQELLAVS